MRDDGANRALEVLTSQERRVFELMASGDSNREIAQKMSLGEQTVKNYSSRILSKLGLARRAQAAAFLAKLRISEADKALDVARSIGNPQQHRSVPRDSQSRSS